MEIRYAYRRWRKKMKWKKILEKNTMYCRASPDAKAF
jgi:hypothetical protein